MAYFSAFVMYRGGVVGATFLVHRAVIVACFYLSAVVFVFIGGEAFVRVFVCACVQFDSTCGTK